ncbi:MAG: hypothetical protein AB3N22_07600 [Ruegeria sp.]
MASALDKLEKLNTYADYLNGAKTIYDETKRLKLATKSNVKNPADLDKIIGLNRKTYEKLAKYFDRTAAALKDTISGGYPPVKDYSRKTFKEVQDLKKKGADQKVIDKKFNTYFNLLEDYHTAMRERISYMDCVSDKCDLNAKNFKKMNDLIAKTDAALTTMMKTFPEQVGNAAALKKLEIHTGRILNRGGVIAKDYLKLKSMSQRHKAEVTKIFKEVDKEYKKASATKIKGVLEDVAGLFCL